MGLELALSTLLSPIVLFFVLGLFAALMRSQMSVPQDFAKGLAIYLMMAIGLKGGVAMSQTPVTSEMLGVFAVATGLSFGLPILAYFALRKLSGMSRVNAAATAGHYGSISIVTFVAATQAVEFSGFTSAGYLVAVAAVMETPAIISALYLAQRGFKKEGQVAGSEKGEVAREVLLNASVVVLVGALLIGLIVGEKGMEKVAPFFVMPFQGVLCLFLLDMGLSAGRGLRQGWRQLDIGSLAFGVYMPVISALITALVCGYGLNLNVGDLTIMMVLAASASYIAVPAAMRLALPKAQPSIYLTLSLGVTFPFNLTVGIPLYILIAQMIAG